MRTNAPRSARIAGYRIAYEDNARYGCWALSFVNLELRRLGELTPNDSDISERFGGAWAKCITFGITPEEFAAEGMNRLEARMAGNPFPG